MLLFFGESSVLNWFYRSYVSGHGPEMCLLVSFSFFRSGTYFSSMLPKDMKTDLSYREMAHSELFDLEADPLRRFVNKRNFCGNLGFDRSFFQIFCNILVMHCSSDKLNVQSGM